MQKQNPVYQICLFDFGVSWYYCKRRSRHSPFGHVVLTVNMVILNCIIKTTNFNIRHKFSTHTLIFFFVFVYILSQQQPTLTNLTERSHFQATEMHWAFKTCFTDHTMSPFHQLGTGQHSQSKRRSDS